MPMSATDQTHLKQISYKDAARLQTRIRTHQLYSVPSIDFPCWVLDHLSWRGDERVVDVGCGAGVYAQPARARCRTYIAADLSLGMVAGVTAEQRIQLDVQALPLARHTADALLANHMLYHVPNKAQALREIKRVLKPQGVLVTATNSRESRQALADLLQQAFEPFGLIPEPLNQSEFTLENGHPLLATHFAEVTRHDETSALVFPNAQPIVEYIASSNDWYLAQAQQQGIDLDWAAVETRLFAILATHFAQHETFIVQKRTGVFICRP